MNKQTMVRSLAVLVAMMVIVGVASAAAPTDVSGTYSILDVYGMPELRPAGDNCILTVDAAYPFDGDLVGMAYAQFTVVVHGPCESALPFAYRENYRATGTFEGTVLGHEGTFDFLYVGRGWPGDPGDQVVASKIIVLSGTGELENLQGTLDITYYLGDPCNCDYYTGKMHVDP